MKAGLTNYQARAYLTILQLKVTKVLPLARSSGIPRNKLYHVLQELERMGLVRAMQREPLEYTARPIAPFLEEKIALLMRLTKEL